MGKRGPPKKPTSLRVLHGTTRKDRYGDPGDEVTPAASTDAPPEHLQDIAREMWQQLAPELKRLGLLSVLDRVQLEVLCEAYATKRMTADSVEWFKAAAAIDRIARQFGMTPSARQGMTAGNTNKDADEMKFFGA